MKYLVIKNDGYIDPKALTLLGGTTKRDDKTKIGYYGSGNKYALAYFIGHGYDVHVFSGMDEITVSAQKSTWRDKEYNIIHINGRETDISTEFGPEWKLWQAVREVYSNAIDEGNATIEIVEDILPVEGRTLFAISMSEGIEDLYKKWNNYFSFKRNDLLYHISFDNHMCDIYPHTKGMPTVYRKGIKANEENDDSVMLFDYDFSILDINESRIASNYEIKYRISEAVRKVNNTEFMTDFITRLKPFHLEWTADYNWYDWNPLWEQVLKDFTIIPEPLKEFYPGYNNPLYVPSSFYNGLTKTSFKENLTFPLGLTKVPYKEVPFSDNENELVEEAVTRLKINDYYSIPKIIKGEVKNNEVIALYDKNAETIVLTNHSLQSSQVLFESLLHEYFHHVSKESDNSIEFERFLLRQVIKKLS